MSHKILVPFDFSRASERALAWASAERKLSGGKVIVFHAINPIPLAAVTMPVVAPPPSPEEIELIRRDLCDVMVKAELDGSPEVVLAPAPGEAVVRAADADGCDLIVMGTHGRGAVARAVLGSVADFVVRHAHCPVVTLRESTVMKQP
jgi:nucleotide-binding universal stress UspA family protein